MPFLDPSPLICREDAPHRPPAWRWDRAGVLLGYARRSPFRTQDDRWVRAAYRLRKALEGCRDSLDVCYALEAAGDLGVAYQLFDEYRALRVGEPPAPGAPRPASALNNHQAGLGRHETEARILARQPHAEIAERVCTTAGVVDAYEKVFFNVADRLQHETWVIHHVIGRQLHDGMTGRDLPVLWKIWGYKCRGNFRLLDQAVSTIKEVMAAGGDDAQAWVLEDGTWVMGMKGSMAARAMPVTAETRARLLELQARHIEARAQAGEAGGADGSGPWQANLQSFFQGVVWGVGGRGQALVGRGGEPRASELLQISAGLEPERPADEFRWPDPARKGDNTL